MTDRHERNFTMWTELGRQLSAKALASGDRG